MHILGAATWVKRVIAAGENGWCGRGEKEMWLSCQMVLKISLTSSERRGGVIPNGGKTVAVLPPPQWDVVTSRCRSRRNCSGRAR